MAARKQTAKRTPAAAKAKKPKGDSPRTKPNNSTGRQESTRQPRGTASRRSTGFGDHELPSGSSGVR